MLMSRRKAPAAKRVLVLQGEEGQKRNELQEGNEMGYLKTLREICLLFLVYFNTVIVDH